MLGLDAGKCSFPLLICYYSGVPFYALARSDYQSCPRSVQTVWAVNQVTLLNPPEEAVPGHILRVLYSCDEPSTVQLDCVVSFDTGFTSKHLLRQWSCIPGGAKIRSLELRLPDWLVYQADGIVPDSQWVLSCMLLASVRHGGFDDSSITAKDAATLQPKPSLDRPVKRHQLCTSWSAQMLHLTQHFTKKQCPFEQGKMRRRT